MSRLPSLRALPLRIRTIHSTTPWRSLLKAKANEGTTPGQHPGQEAPQRPKQQSGHIVFYRELVPAMLPIFILASGVYVALQLTQTYLAHDKYAHLARVRISELEHEIEELRQQTAVDLTRSSTSTNTGGSPQKRWWGLGLV